MMWSGLDDAKIHKFAAEYDWGADLAEQLTSGLELAISEIVVSGLEVVIDLMAIEKHTLRFDFDLLGVEESVTYVLELSDVIGFDKRALLRKVSDLGDELADLVDASANLVVLAMVVVMVVGAILKVLHSKVNVVDDLTGIELASLKVFDLLSLKSAFENTINEQGHVQMVHASRPTGASNTSWING